jgi:formylglycine-generating enzyme required for sulfatase activity
MKCLHVVRGIGGETVILAWWRVSAVYLVLVFVAGMGAAQPPKPKDGPLGMKFVPLPKGTTYLGWNGRAGSAKKTEITEGFEIAIHTVTQGQWLKLMDKNPSLFCRLRKKNELKDISDEDLNRFPVSMCRGKTPKSSSRS